MKKIISLSFLTTIYRMKKIALHWQILIGLVLAFIVGTQFQSILPYIKWIGIMFIRGLKMIVVPLVVTSLLSGMMKMGKVQVLEE